MLTLFLTITIAVHVVWFARLAKPALVAAVSLPARQVLLIAVVLVSIRKQITIIVVLVAMLALPEMYVQAALVY